MSRHLLDGASRRQQHASWVVPDHVRESPQHSSGPFHRPVSPDPDKLMLYIDNAISVTEFAQATRQLSLIYGSSSSSLSMSSSSLSSSPSSSSTAAAPETALLSVKQSADDSSIILPVSSHRKVSRFKSAPPLPQDYINSLLKCNSPEDSNSTSQVSNMMVALEYPPMEADGSSLQAKKDSLEGKDVPNDMGTSAKEQTYDTHTADDAYRAACCALSEGNAELTLSLLQVALAKCPPDKQHALGKLHRLMEAAWQLVEKNSAVLSSLPAEKEL